jgi:PAS domain S-box-containing protein
MAAVNRSLQVLFVEDSANDAALTELELRRAGYQLRSHRAQSREEMVAALDAQGWDLIIADYRLPRFSGIDALAVAKERRLDVPFIIVSGQITEDTAVAAMKAGANDYVMKDKLSRLGPAVERALREAGAQRENRRAESQLEAERAFRSAIENSVPAGVSVVDLEGRQTYVNPAFCAMLGMHERDLIGVTPPFSYWPPEERENINAAMEKVVEGRAAPGGFELRFRRADDERLDVLAQITPLKDAFGNITGWVSSISDITERKRAETRLAAEHAITLILARAPSFADAGPSIAQVLLDSLDLACCAIWLVEGANKKLRLAAVVERNAGGEAPKRISDLLNQGELAQGAGLPARVLRERRSRWVEDVLKEERKHQLGGAAEQGVASAAAFPAQSGGDVLGVIELFAARSRTRDVAVDNMLAAIGSELAQYLQRAKAEAALRSMYDQLELRVEQRTADLRNANVELESAIAERRRLEHDLLEITDKERRRIGLDLHDDLGQRLSGLALMTKGLEVKLASYHAAEAREAAKVHHLMQEAMNHARDLAQDLASLDLNERTLASALEELAAHATRLFRVSCRVRVPAEMPQLPSPVVTQLYKITQESVTNAIKHAKATRVVISVATRAGRLVVSIRNNGRSFPKLASGARGMGLRIMSYRAGLVGGTLEVKGKGTRGTLVRCFVPLPAKG